MIRRLLGAGGLSSVWDAYDEIIGRPVALKTTHDRGDSATMLNHEARALSAIRHPGLPVPYQLGTHHGWTFLAIERLFGMTLARRLHADHTAPPLSVAEIISILVGVAEVLVPVHAARMSHHDVKPDNVMLCADGRVVLLDFGITVPEIDPTGIGSDRGEAHRLDIYAFGIMAFEMLTGRPPFYAANLETLMKLHASQELPDLCIVRDGVRPAFANLIRSCLARCPSFRPDSIELVLWELLALQRPARSRRRSSAPDPRA